jgi:hypothetical protein
MLPDEAEQVARSRWRREMEYVWGVGCAGAMAGGAGLLMSLGLPLGWWLVGGWDAWAWQWVLGVVALIVGGVGLSMLIVGGVVVLRFFFRRSRLRQRGAAAMLRLDQPLEALSFDADAAWIIDDPDGEPIAVYRVEPERFLLLPAQDLRTFSPARAVDGQSGVAQSCVVSGEVVASAEELPPDAPAAQAGATGETGLVRRALVLVDPLEGIILTRTLGEVIAAGRVWLPDSRAAVNHDDFADEVRQLLDGVVSAQPPVVLAGAELPAWLKSQISG